MNVISTQSTAPAPMNCFYRTSDTTIIVIKYHYNCVCTPIYCKLQHWMHVTSANTSSLIFTSSGDFCISITFCMKIHSSAVNFYCEYQYTLQPNATQKCMHPLRKYHNGFVYSLIFLQCWVQLGFNKTAAAQVDQHLKLLS